MNRHSAGVHPNLPKLLVVSSSIFPKRSGSAIVMDNLCRQFRREEMTIVGESSVFGSAATAVGEEGPDYRYFPSRLNFFGRGARFLANIRRKRLPHLVNYLCKVAEEQECSAVLGVYPDELYLEAALQVAIRMNLPFSSYFHNTYLDNSAIHNNRASGLQQKIFERSSSVFTISDGMNQYYADQYALGKCRPLLHTFAEYPKLRGQEAEFKGRGTSTKLVLFGNFNQSNLDATQRLVQVASSSNRYEVTLHTDVPRLLLRQRGLSGPGIEHRPSLGHLPFQSLIDELRHHDIVVLTHGFRGAYGDVEYRTIFPTRTIPMLLCGRPILLHSPPESFLTKFFREHGCGVVVDDPSPEAVLYGLEQIESDGPGRQRLLDCAQAVAGMFYGRRVAEVLRRDMDLKAH